MENEPFGRQRKPVKVVFTGELQDVIYYSRWAAQVFENGGDNTQLGAGYSKAGEPSTKELTIYPRAVND